MPRLLVALATLCACGAVAAAFKTCSPTFDPADVLNLFYANKGDFAWEYLPDSQYPLTPQGGSLEMSETNTPENGAFWIMASTAEDGTTIANLSPACSTSAVPTILPGEMYG
ncbi:hypothetical protein Rhopal_000376-T1 [Rhodotorula paludigena]|uniref:Secreted protein n=1 Tax=Rhodotorula paludigena TaxID=86838 RepID=A0AAV5GEA4_9BASI|nr:hypothetical protein Rhopal_000376-T1 [Rhodotorula paludigena]